MWHHVRTTDFPVSPTTLTVDTSTEDVTVTDRHHYINGFGAAADTPPTKLLEQLANGGVLVVPVGQFEQTMNLYTKDEDGSVSVKETLPVRYVPLTDRSTQLG